MNRWYVSAKMSAMTNRITEAADATPMRFRSTPHP